MKTSPSRTKADWVTRRLGDPDVSTLIMGQSPDSATYNNSGIGLPFSEQYAIAAVLTKIQAAVEVQERIVSTLRELKAATMAKLFREGLRGEPLKQTEIGEIAESWQVAALDEVLRMAQYGLSVRGERSGRYPILRMNCQEDGQVLFRDLQFVDLEDATFKAFKLRDGDLLFNRTNSFELVGRTAIFRGERDAVFASYLLRLRVNEDLLIPAFLNYYLNLDSVRGPLKSLATRGVSQSNISASKLRLFKVCVPVKEEQEQIVMILNRLRETLVAESAKRESMKRLFSSTLHLLMTGQVRVPPETPVRGERAEEQGYPGPQVAGANAPEKLPGVERFVAELVQRFEPERVILFGSHAPGSPQLRAEVSLLVIMPFEGRSLAQAVRIEREIEHDFPLEVAVRRPEEVEDAVEKGNPLIEGILKRGRTLYARPGESPVRRRGQEVPREHRLRRTGKVSEDTLREIVQRIVAAVAPEKIILFGSAARGEMGPDSDVDLMVVKACADRRETARTIRRHLWGVAPGLPKDIVVVTPEDVERDGDTIGYIIRPALREGRTVYAV